MNTFIVTVHKSAPGQHGLVTVLTPGGRIEVRRIEASQTSNFSDPYFAVTLLKQLYPAVANKVLGDRLFRSLSGTTPGTFVQSWEIDVDTSGAPITI